MYHKLIYGPGFVSEKTRYKPGEHVEVIFQWIATDTSYNFSVDADDVSMSCDGSRMFIKFTMPDHDVKIDYSCRNTMVYHPDPAKGLSPFEMAEEPPPQSGEWTCECCGSRNTGKFCPECGSPRSSS
ncbi:MAG: hypothetical protein J5494_02470 [Candidatus Methanomethylophilaceae archaeon]|nr:hypothetical protein [Candidatus Methanomethylophilaceae archaeon]